MSCPPSSVGRAQGSYESQAIETEPVRKGKRKGLLPTSILEERLDIRWRWRCCCLESSTSFSGLVSSRTFRTRKQAPYTFRNMQSDIEDPLALHAPYLIAISWIASPGAYKLSLPCRN
eukprot:76757-Pelagomonas_calceolata.AAC.1